MTVFDRTPAAGVLRVGDAIRDPRSRPMPVAELAGNRWYLTRCRSGCEQAVAAWLGSLGIETFVPMRVQSERVRKGRGETERRDVTRVAIRGYVPARLSPETSGTLALSPALLPRWGFTTAIALNACNNRYGLAHLPDADIDRLRAIDNTGAFRDEAATAPVVNEGDVVAYVFRDGYGREMFEVTSAVAFVHNGRVRLMVKILGKEIEVGIEDVKLIEKTAEGDNHETA